MSDPNDPRGDDAAAALWRRAHALAASADDALLTRAADCILAALVEAVASAHDPRWERGALALAATDGPATVAAGDRHASLADAVAANSFLIHATLSDDAYRLALHPGLAVVPAALAGAETTGARGEAVLRAVAGGYEVACRLADALLPDVSRRGFRITAAIAPVATAATISLLDELPADQAVEALRLACGAAGGGLRTVDAVGEGWSLQPALATGTGIAAVRAATAGLQGAAGIIEMPNGMQGSLCGVPWPGLPDDDDARIHRVTFKEHPVAMYGQAIFDALLRGAPARRTAEVTVVVPTFAADYGHQDSSDAESIGSVAGITRKALAAADPSLAPAITVVGDERLGPLDARVEGAASCSSVAATRAAGDRRTSPRTPSRAPAREPTRSYAPVRTSRRRATSPRSGTAGGRLALTLAGELAEQPQAARAEPDQRHHEQDPEHRDLEAPRGRVAGQQQPDEPAADRRPGEAAAVHERHRRPTSARGVLRRATSKQLIEAAALRPTSASTPTTSGRGATVPGHASSAISAVACSAPGTARTATRALGPQRPTIPTNGRQTVNVSAVATIIEAAVLLSTSCACSRYGTPQIVPTTANGPSVDGA